MKGSKGMVSQPLEEASESGDYLMLNGGGFETTATSGKTALMVAVLAKNLRMVRHMLANGFDVNAQDNLGNTALIYAVHIGSKQLCETLINAGAKITLKNQHGEGPVELARRLNQHTLNQFFADHASGDVSIGIRLIDETLLDGYVIAVRTDRGLLPVVSVANDNTTITVIAVDGTIGVIHISSCEEEVAIDRKLFPEHFNNEQIKALAG